MYKRWVFDGIRFPVGRKFEDVLTMGRIVAKRPFIATTGQGMYLYHWNGGGIMAQSHSDGLLPLLEAQVETVERLGLDTRDSRWHKLYMDMFTIQLHAYRATGRILLRPQRVSLRRSYGAKGLLKAVLLNIFGLKTACRLFKIIKP